MLENEFYALTEAERISDIEELNRILDRAVRLKTVLKADTRIDAAARFIAQHFRENVEPLGYKAFVVAVDREACALYKQALDRYLPPEHTVPVYTRNSADSIDHPLVASLQLDEVHEKDVRKNFPKADKPPKILARGGDGAVPAKPPHGASGAPDEAPPTHQIHAVTGRPPSDSTGRTSLQGSPSTPRRGAPIP